MNNYVCINNSYYLLMYTTFISLNYNINIFKIFKLNRSFDINLLVIYNNETKLNKFRILATKFYF